MSTKNLRAALAKSLALMLLATLVTATGFAQTKTDSVYNSVEKLPRFPGDMESFSQFLKTNIKYPADAKKAKKEGRVNVTFVIERDGSVSNVKSVGRQIDPSLTAEAVRVMIASPKWTAGMQKGQKVRVQFTVPVVFALKS